MEKLSKKFLKMQLELSKSTPPYAGIYMDKTETHFLKTQDLQPFIWLHHIDNIFFIWTHGEAELWKN